MIRLANRRVPPAAVLPPPGPRSAESPGPSIIRAIRQHDAGGGKRRCHAGETLVPLLGTDGRLEPSHGLLACLAPVSEAVQRAVGRLRALGLRVRALRSRPREEGCTRVRPNLGPLRAFALR
jgi:hypothetical protein